MSDVVALMLPPGLLRDALTGLIEMSGLTAVALPWPLDGQTCDPLTWRRHADPGVVVVDDVLAACIGLEAFAQMSRDALPAARILLLAAAVEGALAADALAAGVDAVVLKSSSGEQVVRAIGQVLTGAGVFPAGWLAAANRTDVRLSQRQLQVLDLLARGLANEVIARQLFISPNTVKFHVAAIYQRLGVHNRVEAARAATELLGRRVA